MPRKKNSSKAKAKAKGPLPQHVRHKFNTASSRNNSPFAHSHDYTLAEEARNTASNRRGNRGRDAKLRYKPVTFISAGFMDPLKLFEVPEQTGPSVQAKVAVPHSDVEDDLIPSPPNNEESHIQAPSSNQTVSETSAQPQDECADVGSDLGSDSSEEIILFKGRNATQQQQRRPSLGAANNANDTSDSHGPREINLALRVVQEAVRISVDAESVSQAEELDFISLNENRGNRGNHGRGPSSREPRYNTNTDDEEEEAAIIADYIANMQNNTDKDDDEVEECDGQPGIGTHGFNIFRDLGGTDSDAIPSGPSSEDESFDELHDEADGEDANEDGEERQLLSVDERLARLIAKQEELGLDADDVLLFDGIDFDEGWLPAAMSTPRRRKKGTFKRSKMFQRGGQFPSATQMAEAFDAMDLMDMQCSRLQLSKKDPVSFGLSDSELENALNVALKKDRLKKADKKKAREVLRSQGLLGKNVDSDDLRVKYRGGMSLDELADEFEAFMLSTREQLILPPFDKGARKIIHSIASAFKIKSKSAGVGIGRYPVLYRSKATLLYDQDMFELAFSRIRRTWFPRVDVDEKVVQETRVLKRTEARNGKSRAGKSSLVLREGDIVGQHAAEIGVENKGRAMLEKMGWSKGMSLGTSETKGIVVPLMHVVKKTKAGLGDV